MVPPTAPASTSSVSCSEHELTLRSLGDLVLVLDIDGGFVSWFAPSDQVLLLPPESFLGKSIHDALPAPLADELQRRLDLVRAGEMVPPYEYPVPLDGRETWWSARISARRDASGGLTGFTIVSRDITDRHEAERRVQELNERLTRRLDHLLAPDRDTADLRLEDLFDLSELQRLQDAFAAATGVAALITTPAGEPLTRPSRFCRLCANIIRKTEKGLANCCRSDAELGGCHEAGPRVQPCLSGGLWDAGTSLRAGDLHLANWLIGQVRDESVDEARLLEYAREIGADPDEFRQALLEVPRMSREQFTKVAEALHLLGSQLSLLAMRNLQQARFIAEHQRLEDQVLQARNLETVGQLAGGLAHDFNNLLTSQFMHLSMLRSRSDLPESVQASLDALEASARVAAERTQQLLAFGGRQILQARPTDLSAFLERIAPSLRRVLGDRIAWTVEGSDRPLRVEADEGMIEQALVNLVLNAREAMPDGGRFRLAWGVAPAEIPPRGDRPAASPGRHARVSVSDSGPGISPEAMARLFEPFFSTKSGGPSSGLGLATVHGVMRQHQGWVEACNLPGGGAEFTLFLPLLEQESETFADPLAQARASGAVPRRVGQPVLLVVEDEESVRAVVVTILEMLGYRVVSAGDGPDALAKWERHRDEIDLLFTDMVMPGGMDGRELATRLLSQRPDLPVILSSGYSRDLVRDGLPRTGVFFLEKPYEVAQVIDVLRQALGDLALD